MTSTFEPVPDRIDQQQLAQQLVEAARADEVELIGPRSDTPLPRSLFDFVGGVSDALALHAADVGDPHHHLRRSASRFGTDRSRTGPDGTFDP